ncbi:MAG: putative secreted protein, partial [Acidimicrobiales bacterium]|nr:putative secreted protein [Acidimicrobiales bacterium]
PRVRAAIAQPARGWHFWSSRIRGCESHGRPDSPPDYRAENPDTSASGAYQILDSTWAGRFGVAHASDATPAQQEQAAADEYRRGGTTAWAASAACWRTT